MYYFVKTVNICQHLAKNNSLKIPSTSKNIDSSQKAKNVYCTKIDKNLAKKFVSHMQVWSTYSTKNWIVKDAHAIHQKNHRYRLLIWIIRYCGARATSLSSGSWYKRNEQKLLQELAKYDPRIHATKTKGLHIYIITIITTVNEREMRRLGAHEDKLAARAWVQPCLCLHTDVYTRQR